VAPLTRNQRFAIGLIFTAIAVIFGAWAFYKGCLEGAQAQIVQVFLALAAGFGAWAFSGRIKITSEGDLPGAATGLKAGTKLVIGAAGGFAVWLGTAWMLMPKMEETCAASMRERLFSAVGGIRSMRGDYAFALAGDKVAPGKVLNGGRRLVADLEAVNASKLTAVERVHRDANIGRGYLYMALVWELAEPEKSKAIGIANESLSWTGRARNEMNVLLKGYAPGLARDEAQYARQLQWFKAENYDQFVYQLIGRAHMLAYKAGAKDYAGAVEAFRNVSATYRKTEGLMEEPLFTWFCGKHPAESSICS